MKKTKIVCTLGPSTDDDNVLRCMLKAGMDIARINFSHGTYDDHDQRIKQVERLRSELGLPIAIMLDTRGPEIRLKKFKNGTAVIKAGQTFTLTANDTEGDSTIASITYGDLVSIVNPGTSIMINDGATELIVEYVKSPEIVCKVQNDAELKDNKSINLPGVELPMPYISDKDMEDIRFGISRDIDFVAASFVRTADDVLDMRRFLNENGGELIRIISKIENRQGVDNIEEILKVTDGLMIARGDLGVEIPFEELPHIQKTLIRKTYSSGRMVITATQMLESMMTQPRPTRAEITDIANAVYDGTSAVMLSGETAVGLYPAESVATMSRIIKSTEPNIDYTKYFTLRRSHVEKSITNAISHATCTTAQDLGAAAIITVTKAGNTARMISKFRPNSPIIGCTPEEKTLRQLNLAWGVKPVLIGDKTNTDDLFADAVRSAMDTGIVKKGDLVVLTAGVPVGLSGNTNILKIVIADDPVEK
jgi:pyruvate kinase